MDFPDTVQISKFSSEDVYGKRTYQTATTSKANVRSFIKNLKDFRGNELLSSAWVALPRGSSIAYNDKITLADGSTPYIGSIAERKSPVSHRIEYIEVYVGRAAPGEGSL